MPIHTMEQEMKNYFNQLNEVQQKSIVQMLKRFVQNKQQTLPENFIKEYNRELEESEKEIETGHFVLHEDVMQEIKKW